MDHRTFDEDVNQLRELVALVLADLFRRARRGEEARGVG
jgi:hypothetical protein